MKIRKLQLKRETIRELSGDELGNVAAGIDIPSKARPCQLSVGGTCHRTFCDCTEGLCTTDNTCTG